MFSDVEKMDNALRFYSLRAGKAHSVRGGVRQRDDDALQTLSMLHQNCPDSFEAYHYSYIIHVRKREYDKAQEVLSKGQPIYTMIN